MNSEFGTGRSGQPEDALSPSQPLPLLRPMEIGELLDEAFDLYKKNFRLFFGIAILVSVPFNLLGLAFLNNVSGAWIVRIVNNLVSLLTFSALTDAALYRRLSRRTTIAASYRHALPRMFWVIAGAILYLLACVIGLILFVFPGVVVALWGVMLLLPIIIVENRGWYGLFVRPRQLADGNLWRLFFLGLGLLLIWLIIIAVLSALLVLLAAAAGYDPSQLSQLTSGSGMLMLAGYLFVAALVQSAWTPVFTTTALLGYVDLRIRREAYDLELLTAAVEARVAGARGGAPAGSPLPGQVGG